MGAMNPESLGSSTLGYLQYPFTSLGLLMLSSGIDSELKSLESLGAARLVKNLLGGKTEMELVALHPI